jgi:hypothetical protein
MLPAAPELEYDDCVKRLSATHPELAREFASFVGLEQVLAWMNARGAGRDDIDIVGMDEFSYDFLVRLAPGVEWLSFGVT